jgi:hypothetical protein
MKLTASAKTAIDKAFRHFVSEGKSSRELHRADLTRYLTSCATGKSVIWEIELLPLDYIAKHAFPSPEVLADAARAPTGFVRTPQSRAILEANIKPLPEKERKPTNVANKPKVEPKPKVIPEPSDDNVSFIMRLKSSDIHKLKILAAQEDRSANKYVSQLIKKHLAKFDFGEGMR